MLAPIALALVLTAANDDEPGAPKYVPPPIVQLAPAPAAPPKPELVVPPAKIEEKKTRVGPWVVLGLSVAAGVAGGVFAKRTADAISTPLSIETPGGAQALTDPTAAMDELRAQQTQVVTNGIAASVLLGAASAGLVGSLVALLSD